MIGMKQTYSPDRQSSDPQQGQPMKKSLWDQPRKVVSGMVYSGAIIGMLLISLAFSVTVAVLAQTLQMSLEEIMQSEAYRYCSFLLYQIVYLVIIFAYMRIYRERPSAFGWRGTRPGYFLLAVVLWFGLLFGLNFVNNWFVAFLELFGYTMPDTQLPSLEGSGFLGVMIVVAVLPAICEETLFRGILLEGIKDVGTVAACLLGGLLFSIFHQNPPQTIYQFCCGAAFTLLAIRAESILPTCLMHFLNNALIIFDAKFSFLERLSFPAEVAIYAVSGVCLIGALIWMIWFDKGTNRKKEGSIKPFIYAALAGIILCVVVWLMNLASGFGV